MDTRYCKKCHRVLPPTYKYSKCESCRSLDVHRIKTISKAVLSLTVVIVSAGAKVITKK